LIGDVGVIVDGLHKSKFVKHVVPLSLLLPFHQSCEYTLRGFGDVPYGFKADVRTLHPLAHHKYIVLHRRRTPLLIVVEKGRESCQGVVYEVEVGGVLGRGGGDPRSLEEEPFVDDVVEGG